MSIEIEVILTFTVEEIVEDIELTVEQKRRDKELLEKIKKYGAFNDQGEWIEG